MRDSLEFFCLYWIFHKNSKNLKDEKIRITYEPPSNSHSRIPTMKSISASSCKWFFWRMLRKTLWFLQISWPRSFCSNFVIKILFIKKSVEQALTSSSKKIVKTTIFFVFKFLSLKVAKGHFEKNKKNLQFYNKKDSGGGKNRTASLSKVFAHLYLLRRSSFKLPRAM